MTGGHIWDGGLQLCGHDIQPFADVFADDVTFRAAATGDIGRNDLFNAREVLWKHATTST